MRVRLCNGTDKLLMTCTTWDLLNITADDALVLQSNLLDSQPTEQRDTVNDLLTNYDVQHTGLLGLPQAIAFAPGSAHYSWTRSAAMFGVGRANLRAIALDRAGRLSVEDLADQLTNALAVQQPVLMVVVVCGSTAESAVDPITEVLALRDTFRSRGLDFYLHVDAAWGGYFVSMLREQPFFRATADVVPAFPLSQYVRNQLLNVCKADSITLDPHKSGYIQYPAGALCYRLANFRFMLVFTAPVIGGTDDGSIGTFGIEGSKPGAAACAVYLHHKVVGLHRFGHGHMLGEVQFTSKLLYCYLVTLAEDSDPFRLETYQSLPDAITKEDLRRHILNRSNSEILRDEIALDILRRVGPDLNINAFMINFATPLSANPMQRVWNSSAIRANEANEALAKLLGIQMLPDLETPDVLTRNGVGRRRLFTIRSQLGPFHAAVRASFCTRLGLVDPGDNMTYLVATNMDFYASATGFLSTFVSELRGLILRAIGAVTEAKALHAWAVAEAGPKLLLGDHLSVFADPPHQYHNIASFEVESNLDWRHLVDLINEGPLILSNLEPERLDSLNFQTDYFQCEVWRGFPNPVTNPPLPNFRPRLKVVDVPRMVHFDPAAKQPSRLTYFLVGTSTSDDVLLLSHVPSGPPDFQHTAICSAAISVSKTMFLYGFLVELEIDQQPRLPDQPPLAVGLPYPFRFVGPNGQPESGLLTVLNQLWFDNTILNQQ